MGHGKLSKKKFRKIASKIFKKISWEKSRKEPSQEINIKLNKEIYESYV